MKHQASYNQLYQDGVIQVSNLKYTFAPPDTSIVTFKLTKNGKPFDAKEADSLAIYFAPYVNGKFQFEPAVERFSLKGADLSCDGNGVCTTKVAGTPDFSKVDGLLILYGADEIVGRLPARVRLAKYPFAAILQTGKGVDYVSPANAAGCEKCHTVPYLKHGYIYAEVNKDPATDFYTCKACHLDNVEGGHFEWKLLVEDPALAAAYLAEQVQLTEEQQKALAYKTTLMNDVHMSHAMEFPYPQSMANCATCHEGKLDMILADKNFNIETCKSCHPVTGSEKYGTAARALKTILPPVHESMDLETTDCTSCHSEGGMAPSFREIHTGYDKTIYTADGPRYSDIFTVSIDSASFDGEKLTFSFSAAKSADIEGLDAASITPTVMVGLYGWDTKDFVVGAHERLFDTNNDGKIDRNDQPVLEAALGETHPRVSVVSAGSAKWEATTNLSDWKDLISNGTVKRVEIAVMPALQDADGRILALNAPSRTFDLTANKFADDFYSPIVKVADGCNNCHDALATNYHTPDRGGNIVVCRMCHITKSGAAHLEMQSRSLDSYIHAIHSGQPFDIANMDFTDPVTAMHYEHHIEFPYPTHGPDCESCHVEGTYNVPDQTKSLPGILSAAAEVTTKERKIGAVPSYVTGPASRACGGCHRATFINEDNVSELVSFNAHTSSGGYLVEAGDKPVDTLMGTIEKVMAYFK